MCSVSLLEEGVLNEFYIEQHDAHRITGNIYKGRVENVVPGLSSAFVDIGNTRNGFLAAADMLEDRSVLAQSGVIPDKLNVVEGDFVMVQAVKEEIGQKGARLTANISLPGRYVVYMPTIDFIGVSNKITDETVREKLSELLKKHKPEGGGFIARTACRDAKKSQILDDIKYLEKLYSSIKQRYDDTSYVSLLHSDGGLIFRMVRDILTDNVKKVICNSEPLAEKLRDSLRDVLPKFANRVESYTGKDDMLAHYGVLREVDKILKRKVDLPGGGSIVIDYTEALTAIDVNSGRYLGETDREETIFKINMEAAQEISRQIRLRNIGGIIVVDFIDMQDSAHGEAVVEKMRSLALNDRTRTNVLSMTELGLVQITRKKTGSEISSLLLHTCPACRGFSQTQSAEYVARKIKAQLMQIFDDPSCTAACITVHESLFESISTRSWFAKELMSEWYGKRIYIVPGTAVNPNAVYVSAMTETILTLPSKARLLT